QGPERGVHWATIAWALGLWHTAGRSTLPRSSDSHPRIPPPRPPTEARKVRHERQARRAQGTPARDLRSLDGERAAAVGPGDVHAARRRGRARPADRAARTPGPRATHRSRDRQAAGRARAVDLDASVRLGRGFV